MQLWQQNIILLYLLLNLFVFLKGYGEITKKNNAFGQTDYLGWLGMFVWGDSFVLGPFWLLVCLISVLLNNWYLFLLLLALFWAVRSLGEIVYWLNEQFANKNRNPANTLRFYKLFRTDAVWFIYQLFWQCVLVFSLLASLYLAALWLRTI